jgi:ABC-2 type transport system ATP-binding protein
LLKNFAVQQGRTVLISSHILSEVEQVVDRVVIITKGRLVYTGELKGLSTKGTTILVRTPTPQLLISALAPLKTTITIGEEGILNVIGASLEEVGHAAWLKQVELTRLSELATSLEEVFLSLTADLPKEGE